MNNTTPTINGLRLVTPQEAKVENQDEHGNEVLGVLMKHDRPEWYVFHNRMTSGEINHAVALVPIPKPRTTRPYRREEVKCGDVFRHKETGNDYMVIGNYRNDQVWFLNEHTYTYATLLEYWHKLTYDSEGREVLSVAGIEE